MDIREPFARRQTSHDKTLQFTPIQSRLINSSTGKNKKMFLFCWELSLYIHLNTKCSQTQIQYFPSSQQTEQEEISEVWDQLFLEILLFNIAFACWRDIIHHWNILYSMWSRVECHGYGNRASVAGVSLGTFTLGCWAWSLESSVLQICWLSNVGLQLPFKRQQLERELTLRSE